MSKLLSQTHKKYEIRNVLQFRVDYTREVRNVLYFSVDYREIVKNVLHSSIESIAQAIVLFVIVKTYCWLDIPTCTC